MILPRSYRTPGPALAESRGEVVGLEADDQPAGMLDHRAF
jgi:hypothetical protein